MIRSDLLYIILRWTFELETNEVTRYHFWKIVVVVVVSFANCVHDSPLITDRVIKSLITEIHDQRKLKIFTQNCDEGLGQQIIVGKKSFFQTLGSELNLFNAWQQIRRWGECLVGYYQNITIDTELDRPDNGDHLADQGSIPRREQVCRRSSLPIWWDFHTLRVKVLPCGNLSCFYTFAN